MHQILWLLYIAIIKYRKVIQTFLMMSYIGPSEVECWLIKSTNTVIWDERFLPYRGGVKSVEQNEKRS